MPYKGWTSIKATNGRIADKHQLSRLALLPTTVGQRDTWLFRVAVGRPRAALQLAEICVGASTCQPEMYARASYIVRLPAQLSQVSPLTGSLSTCDEGYSVAPHG